MAIASIKIHPAIGIARLGNSPDGFFIGPEVPGVVPIPSEGYKDAQCRIRRQAARFRLYGYDSANTLIGEVTNAIALISWTVHLANRKAISENFAGSPGLRNPSVTGADRHGLVIDPGPRTLAAPNSQAMFDTGTFTCPVGGSPESVNVPLGELRTDDDGRLLVLGGLGKSGHVGPPPLEDIEWNNNDMWFDDISDGPVTATVSIDGYLIPVTGAWVICPPPDFAPGVATVQTLYDKIISLHWPPPVGVPSYTNDIYPILDRASRIHWTRNSAAPASLDLTTAHALDLAGRTAVVSQIKSLPGNTSSVQQQILNKWKDGTFTQDWTGAPPPPPALGPAALDRAALEACVGEPFFPGIEAGAFVETAAHFSEMLRFDHSTVQPGDVTGRMALPWQADFNACAGDSWWPAQRPNKVRVPLMATEQDWARGVELNLDMVAKWATLGFVVRQGSEYVEVERCGEISVFLRTATLTFKVEQGPGGLPRTDALPIVIEVTSPTADVDLQITVHPNAPFAAVTTGIVTVPKSSLPAEALLWVSYQTGVEVTDPMTPDVSSVTISQIGTTRTWQVDMKGFTLPRTKSAVALVLDRSGSMAEDRGDGEAKIESVRRAAKIFVDAMLKEDAVTLVKFNHDAQSALGILALGDQTADDPNRNTAKDVIDSSDFDPSGGTSIGDGIFKARENLAGTLAEYPEQTIVVLTDGNENTANFIADVSDQIDENVYAIGFGKPENTSAAALQTLSGAHGGYMLITGDIDPTKELLLEKFFVQVLSGISNGEVILDPDGDLLPGEQHQIPFRLTEAEYGFDAYLLSRDAEELEFALKSPQGGLVSPQLAATLHPLGYFIPREAMKLYRLALPVGFGHGKIGHGGTWTALVRRGRSIRRRRTIHYSVVINGYSDLQVQVFGHQKSFEPGSTAAFGLEVTQWGIPLPDVRVWADVAGPRGKRSSTLKFEPGEHGRFRTHFQPDEPGLHQLRILVRGTTLAGRMFEREQTRTVSVWPGGDRPARGAASDDGVRRLPPEIGRLDERLQDLLRRIVMCAGVLDASLIGEIRALGLDPEHAARVGERLTRHSSTARDDLASLPFGFAQKRFELLVNRVTSRD